MDYAKLTSTILTNCKVIRESTRGFLKTGTGLGAWGHQPRTATRFGKIGFTKRKSSLTKDESDAGEDEES